VFIVAGFPASRTKTNPHAGRATTILSGFLTSPAPTERRTEVNAHPELQIVLSADIANMRFPNGTFDRVADPHGMSGSPLWKLEGGLLHCAGILIEHHKDKKLVVASDIAVALHLVDGLIARMPFDHESRDHPVDAEPGSA